MSMFVLAPVSTSTEYSPSELGISMADLHKFRLGKDRPGFRLDCYSYCGLENQLIQARKQTDLQYMSTLVGGRRVMQAVGMEILRNVEKIIEFPEEDVTTDDIQRMVRSRNLTPSYQLALHPCPWRDVMSQFGWMAPRQLESPANYFSFAGIYLSHEIPVTPCLNMRKEGQARCLEFAPYDMATAIYQLAGTQVIISV